MQVRRHSSLFVHSNCKTLKPEKITQGGLEWMQWLPRYSRLNNLKRLGPMGKWHCFALPKLQHKWGHFCDYMFSRYRIEKCLHLIEPEEIRKKCEPDFKRHKRKVCASRQCRLPQVLRKVYDKNCSEPTKSRGQTKSKNPLLNDVVELEVKDWPVRSKI